MDVTKQLEEVLDQIPDASKTELEVIEQRVDLLIKIGDAVN